jgi:hypothetical protein
MRSYKHFSGSRANGRATTLGDSSGFRDSFLAFRKGCGFRLSRGVNPFERFLVSRALKLLPQALVTTRYALITFDLTTLVRIRINGIQWSEYHTFRLLHCIHPARDLTLRASDILSLFRKYGRLLTSNETGTAYA